MTYEDAYKIVNRIAIHMDLSTDDFLTSHEDVKV